MSHDEWLDRADLYALGALDGEELGRFEDHLDSGCEECGRQLRETREVLLQVPRSLSPLAPSPDVKRRLMARVAREAADSTPRAALARRRLSWARVGLAASVLLLIGLVGFAAWDDWNLRNQLRDLDAEAVMLRSQLVQRKDIIRYLDDPEVAIIPLAGLGPSPGASGRVLWLQSDRSGYLLSRGLPPAPAGHKYAVWAIAASGPVPAGLFTHEEVRRARLRLPASPTPPEGPFRQFAVTLEPTPGGPRPTGPQHLLGSLASAAPARSLTGHEERRAKSPPPKLQKVLEAGMAANAPDNPLPPG